MAFFTSSYDVVMDAKSLAQLNPKKLLDQASALYYGGSRWHHWMRLIVHVLTIAKMAFSDLPG